MNHIIMLPTAGYCCSIVVYISPSILRYRHRNLIKYSSTSLKRYASYVYNIIINIIIYNIRYNMIWRLQHQ